MNPDDFNELEVAPDAFRSDAFVKKLVRAHFENRSVIILEGERGIGKTTILRYYGTLAKRSDNSDLNDVVYLGHPDAAQKWVRALTDRNELVRKLILLDNVERWPLESVLQIIGDVIAIGARMIIAGLPGFAAKLLAKASSLENRIQRIELEKFDASAIRELLIKQLGDELSDDEIQRVIAGANGLPRQALDTAHQMLRERTAGGGANPPEPVLGTLDFIVDPGEATAEDLARFYVALSDIYRAHGGTGLIFDPDGASIVIQAGQPL